MVQEQIKKRSLFDRFISGVEFVGNKLPHPFWIFVILIGVLAVISWILSLAEVSVTYTAAARSAGDAPKEVTETVKNLMSLDVLKDYLVNFTKNYSGFWPMGLVMSMMVAIGVAEHSGLIMALMRRAILGAPMVMITAIIAIVGINSNLASDAGVVFTPAIAAAMFKALGLNPWVGIITGYAAANGGFTANFFIAGTDALLSGITGSVTSAAHIDAPVHPLMNWYFMMAATVVITVATVIVTKYFLIPHLGGNKGELDREEISKHALTEDEMRGLRWSRNTTIAFFLLLIVAVIPESSFLRNPDGTLLPRSPLIGSIVGLLFFFFVFVGISYGYGAKTIRSSADIPAMMQKGLASALSFLVVALPAAIFISLFNESKLATVLAVKGADVLMGADLTGIPLFILFILIAAFVNLFITAGSAKWLIMAPIFVPMLAMMGFSPAMTQVMYRIGDSCTNIISPIDYYVPVIIGLLEAYRTDPDRKVGIGTLISLSFPFSLAYMIGLFALLMLWYTLQLPLGPGVSMFM